MKRLNNLLRKAGILAPAVKETELLALFRDSPLTKDDDVTSVIAIPITSEEEILKTKNAVNSTIKALPQWTFGTKLDRTKLILYVGKYERELQESSVSSVPETNETEVQP